MIEATKETMEVIRWGDPSNSRIGISNVEFTDNDRVHFDVNDMFDVCIIRTDEGIVIDVYPVDELADPIATTYAYDNEVIQP